MIERMKRIKSGLEKGSGMEKETKRVSSSVAGFIKTEIHAGEAAENTWLINKVTKAYQIFTCE